MFTEPDDVKVIKSKDYDPILGGAVESVPADGYTIYDKTVIREGSMTVQQLLTHMEQTKGVEVQMVTCGNVAVYNAYLPGNAPRLEKKIEDIVKDLSGKDLPAGREYLVLETGGIVKATDNDYQMPPIQYYITK
jgi:hypothetical protein